MALPPIGALSDIVSAVRLIVPVLRSGIETASEAPGRAVADSPPLSLTASLFGLPLNEMVEPVLSDSNVVAKSAVAVKSPRLSAPAPAAIDTVWARIRFNSAPVSTRPAFPPARLICRLALAGARFTAIA